MLEYVWRYSWVESMFDLFRFLLRLILCLLFVKLVKLDFTYIVLYRA